MENKIRDIENIVSLLFQGSEESKELGLTLAKGQSLKREVIDYAKKNIVDAKILQILGVFGEVVSCAIEPIRELAGNEMLTVGERLRVELFDRGREEEATIEDFETISLVRGLFHISQELDTPIFEQFKPMSPAGYICGINDDPSDSCQNNSGTTIIPLL